MASLFCKLMGGLCRKVLWFGDFAKKQIPVVQTSKEFGGDYGGLGFGGLL